MPNVEIHGFGQDTDKIMSTCDRVEELFGCSRFKNDMVVTVVLDSCTDLMGTIQPFLRLCTTEPHEVDEIVHELKKLHMDIEVLILHSFHPKN